MIYRYIEHTLSSASILRSARCEIVQYSTVERQTAFRGCELAAMILTVTRSGEGRQPTLTRQMFDDRPRRDELVQTED